MRAIVAHEAGGPGVLTPITLPEPSPARGQVRISVQAAAITFVDTLMRSGSPNGRAVQFPVVLGNGVGGIVDATGVGVDRDWMGARVVASTGGTGGYASAALANAADLHRVPDRLGLADATALLADGRTAVGLSDAARIHQGETVVVSAAAGGVGGLLVQLAARKGARVVALAGSQQKLEHARALGADTALNYRDPEWLSLLDAAAPDGVDVVFDGIGAELTPSLAQRVRTNGRYLPHGAAGGSWGSLDESALAARSITVIPLGAIGDTPERLCALVERALELGAQGVIRSVIGQTFPLEAAAEAHAAIQARTTIGKTLLLP